MIRPNIPHDDYENNFSFPASQLVLNKALTLNCTVKDLKENDASRAKVEQTITNEDPDFIIHYDHGKPFTLFGQNNNSKEAVLDQNNVNKLSNRALSTVSCFSASGLGPLAIAHNARAYLGYTILHWANYWYANDCIEAANEANFALLKGKTFAQAYNLGCVKYTQKFYQLIQVDIMAAATMLWNRIHFVRLGDPNEQAI